MTDDTLQPNLTQRQEKLLEILIREYISHPEPVSSKMLAVLADLGLSSATVRNEMAMLEEVGFIRAPHTSAGRIPTEEGYRYFVKRLIDEPSLPEPNSAVIQAQFQDITPEIETWMRNAARILAQQTNTAALVTEPTYTSHLFKQVQLISVQGRMVLMVLVLDGGNVHQQMLIMAEPIPQERLNQAAADINRYCQDLTSDKIREITRNLPSVLAQEIGELVSEALQQMVSFDKRTVYQAGLGNILLEFEEEGARQAIKVLEGNIALDTLFNNLSDNQIGSARVLIGGDSEWQELSSLSLVLGRYSTGHVMGTVGVVGPTRMHYGRAISTVSYIANLLSNYMGNLHTANSENIEADDDIDE